MRDFQLDAVIKPIFSFLFLLAHITSMSATCWNPILYAWMNENFRREFRAALPCFKVSENILDLHERGDSGGTSDVIDTESNGLAVPLRYKRRHYGNNDDHR